MDRKKLYEKAEEVLNQAFEIGKKSVQTLAKKTGEAAHTTKLLIDKVGLEHRVSKKFAELGNRIYERALAQDNAISLEDEDIKLLIEDTKRLEDELSKVEADLKRQSKPRKSRK